MTQLDETDCCSRFHFSNFGMIGILKDYTGWNFPNVAVGRINEEAALTGFSYEKRCVRFAGNNIAGRNYEVTVLMRCRVNEVAVITR